MTIHITNECEAPVDEDWLASIATSVLQAEGYPPSAEVSLFLVTDEEMAGLNLQALGREGATDVLSFPLESLQPGRTPQSDPGGPPLLLGDVMIAPGYVRRQAGELGVPYESELALMVAHGVLHLLGYDHHEELEAEVMEGIERNILAGAGLERRG